MVRKAFVKVILYGLLATLGCRLSDSVAVIGYLRVIPAMTPANRQPTHGLLVKLDYVHYQLTIGEHSPTVLRYSQCAVTCRHPFGFAWRHSLSTAQHTDSAR